MITTSYRIRRATDNDTQEIAYLVADCLGEFGRELDLQSDDRDLMDIDHYYRGGIFLVAEQKGRIIGSAALAPTTPGEGLMKKMYLRKEYRGAGIGRHLVQQILDWAPAHNMFKITLETMQEMHVARSLYERFGFHEVKKLPLSTRSDVVMEKTLCMAGWLRENAGARLELNFSQLENYYEHMPEGALLQQLRPQKWTIHQNIAHLTRYQEVFIARMRKVSRSDETLFFESYNAEADGKFHFYCTDTTVNLLKQMKHDRAVLLNIIRNLHADDLLKTAVHSLYGEMTVPAWFDFFIQHEQHHLYTILQLAGIYQKDVVEVCFQHHL